MLALSGTKPTGRSLLRAAQVFGQADVLVLDGLRHQAGQLLGTGLVGVGRICAQRVVGQRDALRTERVVPGSG